MKRKIEKILKDEKYYECIKDLYNHDVVKQMDEYIQHGKTTTLDHCIRVSYTSYKIAKFFKLDYISAARAGLLHDLYLYDWHTNNEKTKFFEKHGFSHPKKALENASKYFDLKDVEKDIIVKHMWPLTLRNVPQYRESFVVSFVDKYKSCGETLVPVVTKASNYAIFLVNIIVNLIK